MTGHPAAFGMPLAISRCAPADWRPWPRRWAARRAASRYASGPRVDTAETPASPADPRANETRSRPLDPPGPGLAAIVRANRRGLATRSSRKSAELETFALPD